jgi:predicted restriction endonuclease
VASHIKPWSLSKNSERLDRFNGLLLCPNLDKAFDGGFITFEADGAIRLSPQLTEAGTFGITLDMSVALLPEHEPYMAFHRTKRFKAT